MTNPALDTISDGTPDADESFLADFKSQMENGSPISEDSGRSPEPTPDAVESAPADVPTVAEPETPSDPAAPATAPADIPSTPLPYTVNGQQKTVDWALQVGDEGVVIPPQHVAKLQDLIQRDEWQNTQNRDLYAKTQQYDALTHKVGDTEYRGMDAFRQLQAEKAMLDASGGKVMAALADPQFVTDLALAYQSGDQTQVQNVLAGIIQQVKFAGERAQFDTLKTISQQETQVKQSQESTQVQSQEYTQIIADFGRALPALTPDDLRAMHDHFTAFRSHIFRPATLTEAQQLGVRPGSIIKDPTVMYQWAQDRAKLREELTAATKATQKAAQENSARQAQPVRPVKSVKKPTKAAPASAKDARFEGDDGSYAAWKKRLEVGKWAHDDQMAET